MWLPEIADPVPAILEYLPYRKGDAFAARDARHHAYFAGFGYAGVRVDLRGSGDSDGILLDEYLPRSRTTRWRSSRGSPASRGAAARSGCSGSRGAASTASRSRRAARPR
jgi:hypothetical protein